MFMNTIVCGDVSKPKLVILCGFGSAGALLFRIVGPLMDHFCVILVDMVGMGSNSLPDNYYDRFIKPQESADYFI